MCWTVIFTGEMTMIADPRIVRREQFSQMTTHRATVCLPLLFRQCFHGHVGGYDIFHALCQIVELLSERYTAFIAEVIRR